MGSCYPKARDAAAASRERLGYYGTNTLSPTDPQGVYWCFNKTGRFHFFPLFRCFWPHWVPPHIISFFLFLFWVIFYLFLSFRLKHPLGSHALLKYILKKSLLYSLPLTLSFYKMTLFFHSSLSICLASSDLSPLILFLITSFFLWCVFLCLCS